MKTKLTTEEARAAWLVDLRYGELQQAQWYLHTGEGFCGLGVGCNVLVKAGEAKWAPEEDRIFDFDHPDLFGVNTSTLPKEVQDLFGLRDEEVRALAVLNDYGNATFTEIADLLERRFQGDMLAIVKAARE